MNFIAIVLCSHSCSSLNLSLFMSLYRYVITQISLSLLLSVTSPFCFVSVPPDLTLNLYLSQCVKLIRCNRVRINAIMFSGGGRQPSELSCFVEFGNGNIYSGVCGFFTELW